MRHAWLASATLGWLLFSVPPGTFGGSSQGARPQPSAKQRRGTATNVAAAIAAYLDAHARNGDLSGVVVIRQHGKEIFRGIYGKANYELGVPFMRGTRFRIASLTKTFTAAAIVRLVERGLLRLDDPVSKYVPDFPNGPKITIRHLLLHQSGLANPDPPADPTQTFTTEQAVARFRDKPLQFEPGTEGRYSGAGYTLLALIVERASGKSYDEFLRTEFFEPLGMANTGNFSNLQIVPQRAAGYYPGPPPAGVTNALNEELSAITGAGSLYSTADDLLRWLAALRENRVIRLSALEYPYGWGRRKYFDRDAIEQTGLVEGFTSVMQTYFKDELDIVALLNIESGFFNHGGKDLAGIVFGIPAPAVAPRPAAVKLNGEALDAFAGVYTAGPFRFHIVRNGDVLFYRFEGARMLKYLFPVSDTELFIPDSGGRLLVTTREVSGVTEMAGKGSFDGLTFHRIAP